MKTKKQIEKAIREIRKDDRMKAKPALVEINAPLALIQSNFEGQLRALAWVLADD